VISVARSLEENTNLRELYIGDNHFGLGGATALGSALERNCSLLTLDIGGCDLSKKASCEHLSTGIKKNESLIEINVSRCKMTDEGLHLFVEAVEVNMCLEKVLYHCNYCSSKLLAVMEYATSRERKPAALLLDNMEANRLQRRKEINDREEEELARQVENENNTKDLKNNSEKNAPLEPGVLIWVPVSFGRKNNVLGKLEVNSTTTLLEAREKMEHFGDLGDQYNFVNCNDGKTIPVEDEAKRQVVWDCGRHVLLKPTNWIVL